MSSEPIQIQGAPNILGVVDSLELLSHRTSATNQLHNNEITSCDSSKSDIQVENVNTSQPASNKSINENFPPYLKLPSFCHHQNHHYIKMTDNEWKHLEDSKNLRHERKSSVQFEDQLELEERNSRGSRSASNKSSILKNSSEIIQKIETNADVDALYPIHKKCCEALGNLRIDSILKMLCSEHSENQN